MNPSGANGDQDHGFKSVGVYKRMREYSAEQHSDKLKHLINIMWAADLKLDFRISGIDHDTSAKCLEFFLFLMLLLFLRYVPWIGARLACSGIQVSSANLLAFPKSMHV